MIKHMDDLSDEQLIEKWVSNVYDQYFCGDTVFQTKRPIDPSQLVLWRKKLGEEGMALRLQTVLTSALAFIKTVEKESLAHVCVDTTAMEKNIAHPTDSNLLEKMRKKLVSFITGHHLKIRRSYSRQGPRIAKK